jgi:hypothetical protein
LPYKLNGMDSKITLSFSEEVIEKAKKFAEANNISLSRLTEILYRRITSENYKSLEELPVSKWVSQLAEGEIVYKKKSRSRKSLKAEFYKSRK